MYSAIDQGSTHTGRSKKVTWGTYDVYKVNTYRETSTHKITTRHYETRDKKTISTTDKYLDHRLCGVCGYNWDIDRTEITETTKRY